MSKNQNDKDSKRGLASADEAKEEWHALVEKRLTMKEDRKGSR